MAMCAHYMDNSYVNSLAAAARLAFWREYCTDPSSSHGRVSINREVRIFHIRQCEFE
jgi:hypothetical protein